MDTRETAIHEAGHVVALLHFSDEIPEGWESVTIEPTTDSLGHVARRGIHSYFDPSYFGFDKDDEWNREFAGFSQRELEARLSVILAGEAATFNESGRRDEFGSGRATWEGDFESGMSIIERIFSVGENPKDAGNQAAYHYLETLFWRTVMLLRCPILKEKVDLIAQALSDRRTLTADECREVAYADPIREGR